MQPWKKMLVHNLVFQFCMLLVKFQGDYLVISLWRIAL